MKPLRIAMYVHSLNPRGGVVHALSVAEALQSMGHLVVLVAPAKAGERLFRPTTVATNLFPAASVAGDLAALVRQRVPEYITAVRSSFESFDIHHAHDGMSGFALAQLRKRGEIDRLARTVHHLDEFDDPYLAAAQDESVTSADLLLCVSRLWADRLRSQFSRAATVIPNGVDTERFSPQRRDSDEADCESAAGPLPGPMFLAVGGVEWRKNTLAILDAFLGARPALAADATLVIAGGASLLDHSDYRRRFDSMLANSPYPGRVRVIGPVNDPIMPALYRRATALVFPSLVEGFGLAVLEALASGTPVITSRIPPFTEYLTAAEALLVDPTSVPDIAATMIRAADPAVARDYAFRGLAVARRFSWHNSASEQIAAYQQLIERR